MTMKLRRHLALLGIVSVTVASVACMQLSPSVWPVRAGSGPAVAPDIDAAARAMPTPAAPEQAPPATVEARAPAGQTGRQTVTVRRGPIEQVLELSGRVTGVEEVPLSFPTAARVETVSVTPGQSVEAGQALLEAGRKEVGKDLEAARARVEVSEVRLSQAEAQLQARQRDAERQSEAAQARQQDAVREAEAGLRRALADLERVKAGASVVDRRSAEAAVVSARAELQRAESELARIVAGPGETEIKTAEQQVASARLELQRAQVAFDRLKAGPDPADLRAAQLEVTNAQSAVVRATVELERLVRGDPLAVSSAERELQRAESALRAAQNTRIVSSGGNDNRSRGAKDAERNARIAREASITSAQLAVKDARDRLNAVRQGPPPAEVELARRNVQAAQTGLQAAQDRYQVVAKGPDELALATANQAVESAKAAVESAEARYLGLKAGAPADRVADAKSAVSSARLALEGATARLAEVNSHPTPAERSDAEERVALASAAVERARAEPLTVAARPDDPAEPESFDLVVLQKNLQQDRALVASLEQDYAATRLSAPFAGTVASVLVRPGDQLEVARPVIVLARGGTPVVRADLADGDAARLKPGQPATVRVDATEGARFDATLSAVEDADGVGPVARLDVAWPSSSPLALGTAVQAAVTVEHKDEALLVPQRAIRAAGPRRYVELADSSGGTGRRTVDVQVGIVAGGDAEILSGLDAGQAVVVGP
jgi:multidrug resistance efflux pump